MSFLRLTAATAIAAALLVSAPLRAEAPPTFRPSTGNSVAEAERFARELVSFRPPWLHLGAIAFEVSPYVPPPPDYLMTVGQLHDQRLTANGQIPDEFSAPPMLNTLDLEPVGLRFGPVEPNCMQGYSLTQQFFSPKVSRDARRVWALLRDDPFPVSEPATFSMLRSIISPGLSRNFGDRNSLGVGMRLAPDKGFNAYCANTSYTVRF